MSETFNTAGAPTPNGPVVGRWAATPPPTSESLRPAPLPVRAAAPSQAVNSKSVTPPSLPAHDVTMSGGDGVKRTWLDDPKLPACLVSTIVHTLVLIALALWQLTPLGDRFNTVVMRLGPPEETVTMSRLVETDVVEVTVADPINETVEVTQGGEEAWLDESDTGRLRPTATGGSQSGNGEVTPEMNQEVTAMLVAPSPESLRLVRLPSTSSLQGRSPEERQRLGDRYGATAESEAAVELALEWLAAHQRTSGGWTFDLNVEPCNGRCSHSHDSSDSPTPTTGATGLALLAFLGAGYTQDEGKYAEVVRRGLYYLRSVGGEAEAGIDWQQGSMYGHGIALMAMAEASAMARKGGHENADWRKLTQRGTTFTTHAQHSSGSWGYIPGSPGDTTLTGWQVLALIAARRNDIGLPSVTLPRAQRFIHSTSQEGRYWFGYKGPPGEPTNTAIALTLLLYLGESPEVTPFYEAITAMAKRGPTLNNVYHDYYATLALHHVQHPLWDQWNSKLRDHLVAQQAQDGHERGSWHFKDRYGDVGGRLYTTAMCAMILEVYYRYLPLYGPLDEFPL